MQPTKDYFLIRIDKAAQNERRASIQSESAWLGISGSNTKPTKSAYGCVIGKVEPNSPAAAAFLAVGDTIVSINKKQVEMIHDVVDALSELRPLDTIEIEYISHLQTEKHSLPIAKKIKLGRKETTLYKSLVQEMENNLQFGEIVGIGEEVHKQLPEAELHDYLIFHHNVEYKPRATGDINFNDWHLQATLENGDELRVVRESELFGVWKPSEVKIVPHKDWIFCHYDIQPADFQMYNGLWLPLSWDLKQDEIDQKLESLKLQFEEMSTATILTKKTTDDNFKKKEEIIKELDRINTEREALSKERNQKKLIECTIIFNNEGNQKLLGDLLQPGDVVVCDMYSLYPLEFAGVRYALANFRSVEYLINKNLTSMRKEIKIENLKPLHDRVFVMKDKAEDVTEGGIIIADIAKTSNTGQVIAAGPGMYSKDGGLIPVSLKKDDDVIFSPMAGTNVTVEGKELLLMRESDVYSTF